MNARMRLSLVLLTLLYPSAAAPANGTAESGRDWLAVFSDHLQHNVLQFWADHAVDRQYGGLLEASATFVGVQCKIKPYRRSAEICSNKDSARW